MLIKIVVAIIYKIAEFGLCFNSARFFRIMPYLLHTGLNCALPLTNEQHHSPEEQLQTIMEKTPTFFAVGVFIVKARGVEALTEDQATRLSTGVVTD
ncbi:hypothetical protein [Paenibacillus sp. KS-LC4]|uniref:hypothetical protein n=1 Tax=Paenibacillus sp. KS-LC4 TaxID=2979727 RepID=UPI0030D04188